MTPAQAATLLTIAAAYDNRKPDEDQARAWAMALAGVDLQDCQRAVVEHYRKTRSWLMPADVLEGVKRIRWERWDAYSRQHGPLLPPADLDGDPDAEMRWIAQTKAGILSGQITDPPDQGSRGELKPRDIASLGLVGKRIPDA